MHTFTRREFNAAALVALGGDWRSSFDHGAWPSEPPSGCPFQASPTLKGIAFTGRHASYTDADTWYPSWASDGNLYSPFTDGKVNGVVSISDAIDIAKPGHPANWPEKATTGFATLVGDDPLALRIERPGTFPGDPKPYGGRYPCGSLVYNGTWFYGTYCLADSDGEPSRGLNWDILGPFVGFRWSKDLGASWTDTPYTPAKPIFPEPEKTGGPVKVGSPHFVDFGRNLEHSPDGKAYLVAHGGDGSNPNPRPGNLSWITGDQVYLLRVKPTVSDINDASRYEYFAGHNAAGQPRWSRDFGDLRPLLSWNNRMGCVTVTYNAPLRKYLMCVTDGVDTVSKFHTYVLEADAITGPWRLVTYMREFGEQAYFVNLPSKFIGGDGRRLWMAYAANFSQQVKPRAIPPGGRYGLVLQEVRLL